MHQCGVCGEIMDEESMDLGEFWDPNSPDEESILAHADCGVNARLEVA
jgi:hypothetical protein